MNGDNVTPLVGLGCFPAGNFALVRMILVSSAMDAYRPECVAPLYTPALGVPEIGCGACHDGAMTWIAPDVARGPRTDMACGEREMLDNWLKLRRVFLLRKCAGLTAEQLKIASVEPSGLTLLGILRHMAAVERSWFREKYLHEDLPELYSTEEHPNGDFDLVADADAEADYAAFLAETAACDAAVAGRDLDEPADDFGAPTGEVSLRWVYLHILEEYAQHTGHADFIRERIDGATGA